MNIGVSPNAILTGGPGDLISDIDRIRYVEDQCDRLKLLRGNRYDHFERSAETVPHELGELRVFVWSGLTYVAE